MVIENLIPPHNVPLLNSDGVVIGSVDGFKSDGNRITAIAKFGPRKPGVPSQDEMYKFLKARSIELQCGKE